VSESKPQTPQTESTEKATKHSAGFKKAAEAFKDSPNAKTAAEVETELSKGTYENDTVMLAELLEAVGPDAYNRYVHNDWSDA
jgi:hypothetical protein